jgi:transposase
MLWCVLLYGYCIGIHSSRQLAKALENDVNFRFLSGNQQPDFRTLSDFRKKFISLFENLFVHVLELCIEAGLTRVGRVALDGTKIEANAALKQNRTREGLEKEIQTILGNVAKTDREEDQEFGPENGETSFPKTFAIHLNG